MRISRSATIGVALMLAPAFPASGQGNRPPATNAPVSSARIETAPLDVVQPDAYQVPLVLEPARSVAIMATNDGIVQSLLVKVGDSLRERQEIARLDPAEAMAHLAIAQAELQERQAIAQQGSSPSAIAQAQVDAAQARVELAQIAMDRCTLRAPFAGVLHAVLVDQGQFVARGTALAEMADVSALRALVPVDRTSAQINQAIRLNVEGQDVEGRIVAMVPLPERFAVLQNLPTSWAAAWVEILAPAASGLQPGQRVLSPHIPSAPIAVVPARALRGSNPSAVQVIRNEYVAGVPVRVLGERTPGRIQVTGDLRPGDVLVVESSSALADGTLVRFGSGSGASSSLQTTPPDPNASGEVARIEGAGQPVPSAGVAPLGAPDSALPKASPRPSAGRGAPAQTPARPARTPPPGAQPF